MWIRAVVVALLALALWSWLGWLRPYLKESEEVQVQIDDEKIREALRPRSVEMIEKARRNPLKTYVPVGPGQDPQRAQKFEELIEPGKVLVLGPMEWASRTQAIVLLRLQAKPGGGEAELAGEVYMAGDGKKVVSSLAPLLPGGWESQRRAVVDDALANKILAALADWNLPGPAAVAKLTARLGDPAFLIMGPVSGKVFEVRWQFKAGAGSALMLAASAQVRAD